MGMAASQARLLCITARIHDVEYQAQSIQNAKVQLATQEDQAYEEYLTALDATTMTIKTMDPNSGESATLPANFNNLCSRNRAYVAGNINYAITTKDGALVVEEDIMDGYDQFKHKGNNDPYQFAFFMLNNKNVQHIGNIENGEYSKGISEAEESVYLSLDDTEKSTRLKGLREKLENLTAESGNIYIAPTENKKEYEDTLAAYRHELYKKNAAAVFEKANEAEMLPIEEFDTPMFNYYVNIFKQIEEAGDCVSIEGFNGLNGDAANDTEWLQAMVSCGELLIEIVKTDKSNGELDFDSTSPSSDTYLGYTETTKIDKKALAKAEAQYEKKLKDINTKDQKFDLDLSKLETERTALTTEYDSVKKVIEDNIERTFGIFS